jgi:hypothetical protein
VVYFAGAGALRSPTIIARESRSRRQARSLVHRRHHPRQRPRDIAIPEPPERCHQPCQS